MEKRLVKVECDYCGTKFLHDINAEPKIEYQLIPYKDYLRLRMIESTLKGFSTGILSNKDIPEHIREGAVQILEEYFKEEK